MAVPTVITDLSTTIASNVPAGSESPASLDDYQRAHAAFIAQLYANTVAATTVIVASATSTAIGAAISENVDISGTTTITSFDSVAEGINRKGRFTGALTLTHNATSLILPGAANITTAANDRYEARSLGSGNWIVTKYVAASGNIIVPNGTAAAPSLKFATGVGLYKDFTNYVGVSSNGLPSFFIGAYTDSGQHGEVLSYSNTTAGYGGAHVIRLSRGTYAAPAIVNNLDEVGYLQFQAWDGVGYRNVAAMGGVIDGTPGAGDMPGALTFYTTPDGSITGTVRMKIGQAGIVTMGAYGAGTATFSAAGVISSVSDETWKIKDGVPDNPDAMLSKLRPGYWFYNDEKKKSFGEERHLGFYAQNVNEAIGDEAAPKPEEGKPWGYYDRSVLAVTVLSLQKALETIADLQTQINELKALKA
jgi:hypothetical protein